MITQDEVFMQRALELALKARGRTSPNPIVGAVIVKDGKIVGEGYHHQAGTPHAEIHALAAAGEAARGATMYVTLEPCSHYGKTPPCARTLVEAGLRRVVAAVLDPNPQVQGRGMEMLKQAQIETTVGVLERQARRSNEFFFKHITTGRPFVTLKMAMTLDGKIATAAGDSKWISNEASRHYVHELRNIYDAVMVGIGTVLTDNPRLNTRLESTDTKDPIRVIIDSQLDIPLDSQIVQSAEKQPTIVFCNEGSSSVKASRLEKQGIEIIKVDSDSAHIPLHTVLDILGKMNICSILVEGGGTINGSIVDNRLADKVHWFISPKIAGGNRAPSPVGGKGVEQMAAACPVSDVEIKKFGEDILITGYFDF